MAAIAELESTVRIGSAEHTAKLRERSASRALALTLIIGTSVGCVGRSPGQLTAFAAWSGLELHAAATVIEHAPADTLRIRVAAVSVNTDSIGFAYGPGGVGCGPVSIRAERQSSGGTARFDSRSWQPMRGNRPAPRACLLSEIVTAIAPGDSLP